MTKAQPPGFMGAGGGFKQPPSIGVLFGKVVDSSGKGVGGASVVLLGSKFDTTTKKFREVLLKAMNTKNSGNFRFEELPVMGQMILKISYTGYDAFEKKISFIEMPKGAPGGFPGQLKDTASKGQPNGKPTAVPNAIPSGMPSFNASDFEKDLGNIQLNIKQVELKTITVVGTKPGLQMDIDKKVFNVEKNLVTAGGTAVDVMRNVPSLNVDIDGNVSLRNAAPQIYIDGRPTTLSLDQIPADAIESVEVITNPSAKYDASGGNAGILNIILKKNKRSGYNGNVNAGIDKRGGLNGGSSFNIRQDKINFSISAFGNQNKMRSNNATDIRNLINAPNLLVDQTGATRNKGGFLFGRIGLDYFVSNRSTISVGVTRLRGEFNPNDILKSDSAIEGGNIYSYSERVTQNKRIFNGLGTQASYKYLFPKKGRELTADINRFAGKGTGDGLFKTNIYESLGGPQKGSLNQKVLSNNKNSFVTIQSDFVTPLVNGKIETGIRAQIRTTENRQGNYMYDPVQSIYMILPNASANYKNKDDVYAAYVSLTNKVKSFGYQIGLRAESSDYRAELLDSKQVFAYKYPLSLFPSIFLSQKLNAQQDLNINFTRRINRPFFMQNIPFIDSTDQLNWSRGNAGLRPEFTNSVEASYSKKFKGNNSLLISVYYKNTTDLITRYIDTITDGRGEKRPLNTYINANSSRSTGFEFTSQNAITKWWDANTNINIYNSRINIENVYGASQNALWSWFGKMNNSFKLPSNYKIQLSGIYQSKTNLPVSQNQGWGGSGGGPPMGGSQSAAQGYIKAYWFMDVAIQKSFLKNNAASLTFNVTDVFRTRRTYQYSESPFFIQNNFRIGDVPMFRINFSYRFGQMDMSLFKRKNMRGEMEGQQGAMQGIQ